MKKYKVAQMKDGEGKQKMMQGIISKTYMHTDKNVPKKGGGTTAVSIIRIESVLYLANTGDSTCFIAIYHPPDSLDASISERSEEYFHSERDGSKLKLQGVVTLHHQNVRHKANLPEERRRIENLGG